ncbi:MAG TPA: COX15/CtaA family protein [Vicinamibacterales bacterium]|nr:COX15/CtaA family protein [Vicinamibacterales bacterium]
MLSPPSHVIASLPVHVRSQPPARVDWRLQIPELQRRRLRIWLGSIAAMTAAVLVLGGITRLTHSGLSIVAWEPVVGMVPPLTDSQWLERFEAYRQFPEFQQLRRGMTIEEFRGIFWWEYAHRVAARLIGLVFLIPLAVFWLSGQLTRPLARRVAAIFGLGALQGLMGWLMVQSGLVERPSVSHYRLAAHLSLAFVIFGACVWLIRDLAAGPSRLTAAPEARRVVRRGVAVLGVLLAAQVVWGALVAGLKAGFIYNTFPLMAGSLFSPNLGGLSADVRNFVENPATVQWMHRLLGTLLLAAAWGVDFRVRRAEPDRVSARLSAALALLITAQYAVGILTLICIVPIPLAVVHQVAALAVAGVWIVWLHHVGWPGKNLEP